MGKRKRKGTKAEEETRRENNMNEERRRPLGLLPTECRLSLLE